MGSPIFTEATSAVTKSTTLSYTDFSTRSREAASQDWPLFIKHASTEIFAAVSKFASANSKFGDLPPSSKVTRFIVSAAPLVMALPALVDPVNEII